MPTDRKSIGGQFVGRGVAGGWIDSENHIRASSASHSRVSKHCGDGCRGVTVNIGHREVVRPGTAIRGRGKGKRIMEIMSASAILGNLVSEQSQI